VRDFVTEPGPEYRHAPDSAFESFRDLKYGVRIHWGLYCLKNWWDTPRAEHDMGLEFPESDYGLSEFWPHGFPQTHIEAQHVDFFVIR
jgi:hypothetical protein